MPEPVTVATTKEVTVIELDHGAHMSTALRSHYMISLLIGMSALALVLASLVTPRWLVNGNGTWSPLYFHANCRSMDDAICDAQQDKRKAMLALSWIELIAAFLAAIACGLACCTVSKGARVTACVFAFIAAAAALASTILGGTLSNDTSCTDSKGTLLWAFILRVIETGLAVVLVAITTLRAAKRLRHGACSALLLAVAITVLCTASLVGLSWERRTVQSTFFGVPTGPSSQIYFGVWDICTRQGDGCDQREQGLDATMGLLAATVGLLALYMVLFVGRITSILLAPVAFLALGCAIAVAVVFPIWAETNRCNNRSPRDDGYSPDAGVGIFGAGAILTLFLFLLTLVRCLRYRDF